MPLIWAAFALTSRLPGDGLQPSLMAGCGEPGLQTLKTVTNHKQRHSGAQAVDEHQDTAPEQIALHGHQSKNAKQYGRGAGGNGQ